MSVEQNKAVVRRFYDEFLNGRNMAVADELIAPDCVFYMGGNPEPIRGPDGYRRTLAMLTTAFPDIQWTVEDMVAEDDKVAERPVGRGTHLGEFMGVPPTGKPIELRGIAILRLADGKIVENWGMPDMLGLLQQIGALPPPGVAKG
jgi:steroid delta-isomerase-like uncharacterized protein